MADELVFRSFTDLTAEAVPTILAYDVSLKQFVIGTAARKLISSGRLGVQNFKRNIGDADAAFEGKATTKGAKTWALRPDLAGTAAIGSTREASLEFLRALFKEIGETPKHLLVGIPAIPDSEWQNNYRNHVKLLLGELGGLEPVFFPEPFAVFQYYRWCENLIQPSGHSLVVLIVDFGGGTLDSCVIETTAEGNLAKGGATAVPLGVAAVESAGKEIDLALLKQAIYKQTDPRLKKESVESRLTTRPWLLLTVEEMKIELSKQMRGVSMETDCRSFHVERDLALGVYHPECAVTIRLDGEDLKKAVKDLWMAKLGPSVLQTVKQAKFRGASLRITSLDKIVLAGGSSGLPFLRQLLAATLAPEVQVKFSDIVVGRAFDKAVAYGLAIEARERRKKALRTNNSIGPCVFSPLYLYVAQDRGSAAHRPYLKRLAGGKGVNHEPGALLTGPMRIGEFKLDFELKLPFRPTNTLCYWFCDSGDKKNPSGDRLNVQRDILKLPPGVHKQCKLTLAFGADGMVTPTFQFDDHKLNAGPLFYNGLRLSADVDSYIGLDLGTSNSYVVNLWADAPAISKSNYPTFAVSESAGAQLRALEQRFQQAKSDGLLEKERVEEYSRHKQTEFVFHSIKIEGSTLSKGETEALVEGKAIATKTEMQVPINVRDAYQFVLGNAAAYKESPAAFIREIHKIVMKDLDEQAGSYRTTPLKISQMEFEPPAPIDVPPFMELLSEELRGGPKDKSIIHFAGEMHCKLTSIHPFADGNGRTARLLMDAILIQAGLPPVVIVYQDKERYLNCLEQSNRGDLSGFVSLLGEIMPAILEEMKPQKPSVQAKERVVPRLPPGADRDHPRHRLAEIMKQKVENLSISRESRFKAWSAGFAAFREEFQSFCRDFNEQHKKTPYRVKFKLFDTLPFEKYETLLLGRLSPRTWFFGTEILSEHRVETFVFSFQHASVTFVGARKTARLSQSWPPVDVTLSVLRRVDGAYHALANEPIQLREIEYSSGQFLFLKCPSPGIFNVVAKPSIDVITNFLADILNAFF